MLKFYRDVLGMTVAKEVFIQGDWVDRVTGLRGVKADVVYLELPGGGPRVELIRYRAPRSDRPPGIEQPQTQGIRHIAFRVDDIDGVAQPLRDAGVALIDDVQTVPESQVTYAGGARKRLVYFRDPEGNLLELCEYAR
jgi:catechol 2,3-dioxygenase-like lactoylglutathione lyase family enzyme